MKRLILALGISAALALAPAATAFAATPGAVNGTDNASCSGATHQARASANGNFGSSNSWFAPGVKSNPPNTGDHNADVEQEFCK